MKYLYSSTELLVAHECEIENYPTMHWSFETLRRQFHSQSNSSQNPKSMDKKNADSILYDAE